MKWITLKKLDCLQIIYLLSFNKGLSSAESPLNTVTHQAYKHIKN